MEIKNKIKQVILAVICGILLILTLFFGVTAVACQISGGTPNLFGTSLYIVDTDAFELLRKGTALVAKQVQYSEIQPGNIVIFSLENKMPALAEIHSSELSDGVYSFTASTENGSTITLSQSQIVAKGVSYSDFWGGVISFACSPLGILLIAVTPCIVLIIIEVTKFLRKAIPQPEIETVKKQLEIPTYSPDMDKNKVRRPQRNTESLDDSIGLYDATVRRSKNIARTDVLEISSQPESPLFLGPKHKPIAIQNQRRETMPLSQKKLNAAIEASKAEREQAEFDKQRAETVRDIQKNRSAVIAAEKEREEEMLSMRQAAIRSSEQTVRRQAEAAAKRTESKDPEFKPILRAAARSSGDEEQVKQYTPRKTARGNTTHMTSSIPRLDALFNDDNDNVTYNIDDILNGLDSKK